MAGIILLFSATDDISSNLFKASLHITFQCCDGDIHLVMVCLALANVIVNAATGFAEHAKLLHVDNIRKDR